MSDASLSLLAIDDAPEQLIQVRETLRQNGLEIHTANNPETGWHLFQSLRPRIVLLDSRMPQTNALELLGHMVAADPAVDVILMSGHYSAQSAIEAVEKGARDYLSKPLDMQKLRERIAVLIAEAEQRRRVMQLDLELTNMYQFEGIVSRNPRMLDVFAKIRRIAPHFRTVLITGAPGTGKELVARALHRFSPSASGQLALCNCAALADRLLERELFGHVRGGAVDDQAGVFEYADGGTIFLDEVDQLSLVGQGKLLRILEDHQVRPIGSSVARKIDVRVVAASRRDLGVMIAEKRFRADLYERLAAVEIRLPRLAERREDLPLLQRFFLKKFSAQYDKQIAGITRRAQACMAAYPWPGNVRELESVIANASMMTETSIIDIADLPVHICAPAADRPEIDENLLSLDQLQKRHVLRVLERVEGNKARAAEILGIARATIYQMLAKWKAQP